MDHLCQFATKFGLFIFKMSYSLHRFGNRRINIGMDEWTLCLLNWRGITHVKTFFFIPHFFSIYSFIVLVIKNLKLKFPMRNSFKRAEDCPWSFDAPVEHLYNGLSHPVDYRYSIFVLKWTRCSANVNSIGNI